MGATDARIVYSAFGGRTSDLASINFLEHHRFKHYDQVGTGNVCPATHPSTKLRTCDAVKCDLCFQKKIKFRTFKAKFTAFIKVISNNFFFEFTPAITH